MNLKAKKRQQLRRQILMLISHFAAGGAASAHPDYARHVLCMLNFTLDDTDYGYAPDSDVDAEDQGPRAPRAPGP